MLEPMVSISKLVDLLNGKTDSQHDLELILHLHSLGSGLALLPRELLLFSLDFLRGGGGLLHILLALLLVAFKVLSEFLDLLGQFISTRLDRHTGAVETKREQSPLALHTSKTGHELDLTGRETVSSMQSTVHIRVGHGSEEFGVLFTNLGGSHRALGDLC